MKCKCEHCGKMTTVPPEMAKPKEEKPEVEVSIEGDSKSIKEILSELMPKEGA